MLSKTDQKKEELQELKKILAAYNTYESRIPATDLTTKRLITYDNILGALEQGKKTLSKYLPQQNLSQLIDVIHNEAKECVELENSPEAKNKVMFKFAKIKGALNAFDLPLEISGPFHELNFYGIDQEELIEKPVQAVKKALIDYSNPKDIIDRALKILKEEDPNIASEKLESYKKFITQGKYKASNIISEETQEVAIKTVDDIIIAINKTKLVNTCLEKANITNPQTIKTLSPLLFKIPEVDFELKGKKVIEKYVPYLEGKNQMLAKAMIEFANEFGPDGFEPSHVETACKFSIVDRIKELLIGKKIIDQKLSKIQKMYRALRNKSSERLSSIKSTRKMNYECSKSLPDLTKVTEIINNKQGSMPRTQSMDLRNVIKKSDGHKR